MSCDYQFFDYHHYNLKKLQFKRPSITGIESEKYYFIPIRCKTRNIYIKTPKIAVPFGLNIFTNNNTGIKSYYYVVSFTDADIDHNIQSFHEFLSEMEQYCQQIVKDNIINWNLDYQLENLTFKSNFKECNDIPMFRFKITSTGKSLTELYNEKSELCNIEEIENYVTDQCHITSLIEPQNIWMNSTEYGVTWKVHQMQVYRNTKPIGVSLLGDNIEIPHIRIIETTEFSQVSMSPEIPEAPPLPIIDEEKIQKIPKGGHAIFPHLLAIANGEFQLKKVNQNHLDKKKPENRPEISLNEILSIRNQLKKAPPEAVSQPFSIETPSLHDQLMEEIKDKHKKSEQNQNKIENLLMINI